MNTLNKKNIPSGKQRYAYCGKYPCLMANSTINVHFRHVGLPEGNLPKHSETTGATDTKRSPSDYHQIFRSDIQSSSIQLHGVVRQSRRVRCSERVQRVDQLYSVATVTLT